MDEKAFQARCLEDVDRDLAYWLNDCPNPEQAKRQLLLLTALELMSAAARVDEASTVSAIGEGYRAAFVLYHCLGSEPHPLPERPIEGAKSRLYRSAGLICELTKKHLYMGREFAAVRDPILQQLKRYVDALATLDAQEPHATFDAFRRE